MTLACLDYLASQSCTELGPAQPQLVLIIFIIFLEKNIPSPHMENSITFDGFFIETFP